MKWFNDGNAHFQEGRHDQALECWQKALELGRQEKNDQAVSKSLMNIGTAYGAKGEWKKAIQYYHQGLTIEREIGDSESIAECLMNIGDAFFAQEDWSSARDYYEQALELHDEDDQPRARMLLNMGLSLFSEGSWNEAIRYYQKSFELFKELTDLEGISNSLANLGIAYRNMGQWEEAIQAYKQSLEIDKELGDQVGSATDIMNIGIAFEVLGRTKEAIEHYQESLSIFRTLENEKGIATCLLNIGNAFEILKKWDKALDFYEKSREIFEKLDDKSNISKCLTNIGITLRKLGKWEEAIVNYEKSLTWFKSLNDQAAISKCLIDLGVAYYTTGKWEKALEYYKESWDLFRKLGDRPGEALTCINLGLLHQEHGEKNQALKYFIDAFGIYSTLLTHIDKEEYRESYAKEFEELPKLINNLQNLLEEKPIEVKEFVPAEEMEGGAELMNQLLSQLRENIEELNTTMKSQTGYADFSKNVSGLMNLVNKTLTTFSLTEKLRSEKIGKIILDSIETCNICLMLYESCDQDPKASTVLSYLAKINSRLKGSFPELDLIEAIQNTISMVNEESRKSETISGGFALELKFMLLTWIKRLFGLATSNRKLYIESVGKFDDETFRKLESELNGISERLNIEEINYAYEILTLLIITKKISGIPIYQVKFVETSIDPDLLGGFLSAIQSFGSELSKEKTSMEKLVYRGFNINFQDGEYIRCALILKGVITELLSKRLKQFVSDFEEQFHDGLVKETGNISQFEAADPLVKKNFELR